MVRQKDTCGFEILPWLSCGTVIREGSIQMDDQKRQMAVELYHKREHTVDQICRMMGISKPTLFVPT